MVTDQRCPSVEGALQLGEWANSTLGVETSVQRRVRDVDQCSVKERDSTLVVLDEASESDGEWHR